MILYVDYEHRSTYRKAHGEWLYASRTRVAYKLQDLIGQRCLLQRYPDVGPAMVRDIGITAVFISGNGADREAYDPAELAGLTQIIRGGETPVFGFCGGFQLMGLALGAPLERIGQFDQGEIDRHPDYQPGWRTELGYEPVELVGAHPLNARLGDQPVFRHAHSWELKELPDDFINLARTEVTEHQLMVHTELPLAGSQFHPEYWTREHPAGARLIENFCGWAGVRRDLSQ
ncbi:MAG: gamma-glutamyl-gamma-aminobutyrate hydrolase family protein [Acidimicrobiia bacterium]|nr:gamma-glutamyl-gamma-aminobutyrate hydrolase family protein [Acidimicrobiia bacterium]